MLRNCWILSALYLAVGFASVHADSGVHGDPDLHPTCVDVSGNLVVNCGFENGSFEGWVQSGDSSNTIVTGYAAHSGDFGAAFSPPNLGFIAQTIPTDPARTYTVSFWLRANMQPNEFQLFWDGNLIADLINVGDTTYTQYTYRGVTTTSFNTEFKLGFTKVNGFFYLDDVTIEEF